VTPAIDDGDVRIFHGDAREQLALMPSESVHCIVTSPPFFGLRDYGTGSWSGGDPDCDHAQPLAGGTNAQALGKSAHASAANVQRSSVTYRSSCGKCGAARTDAQIGLEDTPEEWVDALVGVLREARRVLRSDGTLWLEVGDSYAAGTPGFKPKDLIGAPWMLAFALRADGWYLRSDTIWARPNPMPESVVDRPTKAHSYVFLLAKSARYFYDAEAIRLAPTGADGYTWEERKELGEGPRRGESHNGPGVRFAAPAAGANARSVWTISTEPTPFAHFATMPTELVARCIKAGTSEHGACSECGAPWQRVTERTLSTPGNRTNNGQIERSSMQRAFDVRREVSVSTLGWEPTCGHRLMPFLQDAPVVPCVVLDPFMGSGTTALVARRCGRHAVGVELSAEYLAIARERLQQLALPL
jgi:DNA modification methylase